MAPQDEERRPNRRRNVRVEVKVHLQDLPEDSPPGEAIVHAYTKGGRLIAQSALGANGVTNLKVPEPKASEALTIIVGPDAKNQKGGMAEMLRRGGQRKSLRIDPGMTEATVTFDVIKQHWTCWFLSRCNVPGKLTKRTELDGMQIDLPVCGVDIEVYEVDPIPLIVARLPDHILDRFRRRVIEPDPWELDVHLPALERIPFPRPPGPDPDPRWPLSVIAERDMTRATPITLPRPISAPVPQGFASGGSSGADGGLSAGSLENLAYAAKTASAAQFRDALVRAPDIARLLICRYFPGGVSMDLVTTATTDECGRFTATFFRGCNNPDKPDLYFKAKRKFGPFTITILAPTPVACHTRWNYECGTHVDLVTRHPAAPTCAPCQPIDTEGVEDWLAFIHIGNLPLSRIRGASPNAAVSGSTNASNEGLVFLNKTEAEAAASFHGRPMGGLLRPHLEFDPDLRAKGVEYYLFSWRKGKTGPFQPLNTHEIHRHYSHVPSGATEPVFEVYPLGPTSVGTKSLYKIPPALPPSGIWVVPDLVENQTNAKFPTGEHAPDLGDSGIYQLKLDLFDGAGNLVNIDAPATRVNYVVPDQLDLSLPATVTTSPADALGLVLDDDGDGLRSFILTLHVDNSPCSAAILPAKLGGTITANACGVLPYDTASVATNVTMPFTALHPHGFATYRFMLKRGVTELGDQRIGGSNPLVHPFAIPPGNFQQSASVSTLTAAYPSLGLPHCDMAAFSEHISVWAMGTNGWRRLSEYDAYDHGAFVLAPEPPAP